MKAPAPRTIEPMLLVRVALLALALTACCSSSSLDWDHIYTRIACEPMTADCDGRLSTGCETDTTTVTDCGGCGVVCAPGRRCVDGTCASD